MNRPLLTRCDSCGMVTTIQYKVKDHPNTLKETYFTCDVCNHHYTCFVTDKKVRDMHKQAKWLREQKKQKELEELQERINSRMGKLKEKIVGGNDGKKTIATL